MTRVIGSMDMRAMGEVRLDGVENANQHWQIVLGAGVGGKRSALPTCIEIRIAVEDPDGYADGWNWRLSGECRLMKKQITSFLAVVLVVVALVGVWFWQEQGGERVADAPVLLSPIAIANIGEYSILNLIAEERGFFQQIGLQATITEYASGPPAVSALLAGKEDVAMAADFVGVSNIFEHENLRIISQFSRHYDFHVLARRDKGIIEPHDLKERRIGVTRKGVGEFFLGSFLIEHGFHFQDIAVVDLPPEELVAELTEGTVDAIVAFNPHVYTLQMNMKDMLASWSAQEKEDTFGLIYTTEAFAREHSETLKRYLRALLAAEEYLARDVDGAQNILAHRMGYEANYIAWIWPRFTFGLGLDQELLIAMENKARWAIKNDLVRKTEVPNYLKYIYFDALETVSPKTITIIK